MLLVGSGQRGGRGHPERFRVSKNLLGTKWGQRVALTSSPFGEILAVDHEFLWGGFCVVLTGDIF